MHHPKSGRLKKVCRVCGRSVGVRMACELGGMITLPSGKLARWSMGGNGAYAVKHRAWRGRRDHEVCPGSQNEVVTVQEFLDSATCQVGDLTLTAGQIRKMGGPKALRGLSQQEIRERVNRL